jgi:hypothetical protein
VQSMISAVGNVLWPLADRMMEGLAIEALAAPAHDPCGGAAAR